jgi:hypothetical protein
LIFVFGDCAGARAMVPWLAGIVAFGLVIGVSAAQADVPALAGWLTGPLPASRSRPRKALAEAWVNPSCPTCHIRPVPGPAADLDAGYSRAALAGDGEHTDRAEGEPGHHEPSHARPTAAATANSSLIAGSSPTSSPGARIDRRIAAFSLSAAWGPRSRAASPLPGRQ